MKIAIFDHLINDSNAIGKCHREIVTRLADKYEFTVFAVKFDNPRPDRIKFVRVPALRRPLLGIMVSFHLIAPLVLWWYKWRTGEEFDLVQGIGGNFLFADLAYVHLCHRVYLRKHRDARPKAIVRRIYSWLYDSIVSMLEPINYRRSKFIVTPSNGLARELKENFAGATDDKIHIISNPINVAYMQKPADFDPAPVRKEIGFTDEQDFIMVFVAAGHFERKGLPILLKALAQVNNRHAKLIVVGGKSYLINEYRHKVARMKLEDQVYFAGFQRDIRPYLWVSDLFTFPSSYEIFPLVSLEAAAAGLPLLTSPLYGVEEFLEHEKNGWIVDRTQYAFAEKITYSLLHRRDLANMGLYAAESVLKYKAESFGQEWAKLYDNIAQNNQKMHKVDSQTPPSLPSQQRQGLSMFGHGMDTDTKQPSS